MGKVPHQTGLGRACRRTDEVDEAPINKEPHARFPRAGLRGREGDPVYAIGGAGVSSTMPRATERSEPKPTKAGDISRFRVMKFSPSSAADDYLRPYMKSLLGLVRRRTNEVDALRAPNA